MSDDVLHPVKIQKDIPVGKSQNLEAVSFKEACARPVIGRTLIRSMLIAVQFDDEPSFKAGEIGNVRAYWLLAPKLEAGKLAATQRGPQLAFSVGLRTAQLPGE